MNRLSSPLTVARSWRDIPQEVAPRSMSREGRKRLVFGFVKWGVAFVMVAVVAWGVWALLETWQKNPTRLAAPVKSEPLRVISWNSDGVLDLPWIEKQLALRKGVTLMELELPKLQQRLLADGQVRNAVLTRKFPDTLVVTLQERFPVGRLRVADRLGEESDYLIARDGVIFPGANFERPVVSSLPWLDGLKLVRLANGFSSVAGMETVADLVEQAQFNVPHLYRNWRIVSLERFANDSEIVVRDTGGTEIIFGLRDTFFLQLAMLNDVMIKAAKMPERTVASINLALGTREVHVAFVPSVAPMPVKTPNNLRHPPVSRNLRRTDRSVSPPVRFTFQPSQPRTTSRDL